jgi:hypothetical protein
MALSGWQTVVITVGVSAVTGLAALLVSVLTGRQARARDEQSSIGSPTLRLSSRQRVSKPSCGSTPPTFRTVVPNRQAGDTISLGANRTLRVVETRLEDEDPVLVVERA